MLTKKFFCPVNGWDCPYWKKDGSCSIVNEGDEPTEECDDAAFFYADDEEIEDLKKALEEHEKKFNEIMREGREE